MFTQDPISIADAYWAAYLGCAPAELFAEPLRLITHDQELLDYDGAFALFRNGHAIASLPPHHFEELRTRLLSYADAAHSPAGFAAALAPMATAVIGPAFIGYAPSIVPPAHPARALTGEDAPLAPALEKACPPTEWAHGGSAIDQPRSGVLVDGQLVALAGYETWGGTIAHIAIVTHPDHRGRGYARSAVAHLAERALAAGLLPQYRTLAANRPSIRIAQALGFREYATSMAVRF